MRECPYSWCAKQGYQTTHTWDIDRWEDSCECGWFSLSKRWVYRMNREFALDELDELEVRYDNELIEEIDSGRWTRYDRVIFKAPDDEKFYQVTVQSGLTEYQDVDGSERYPESRRHATGYDYVSCPEVTKTVVMQPVTLWVEA